MNIKELSKKSSKIWGAFLLVICTLNIIIYSYFFLYCDTKALSLWSIQLTEFLFQGDIIHFYDYVDCMGSYLGIVPLAIWNLPIWFLWHIGKLYSVEISLCYLWSKVFYIVLTFLSSYICALIIERISESETVQINIRHKQLIYVISILLFGSSELVLSVCYAGQDEIVYIFVGLLNLYFWITDKKISYYVSGSIMLALCPFMLMQLLLLECVKCKNIIKLLFNLFVMMMPVFIFEIIYLNQSGYQQLKKNIGFNSANRLIYEMLNGTIIGGVSLSALLLIILYIIAYINIKYTEEGKKKTVFLITCLYITLSFFMGNNFYRLFLYLPFLIIVIISFDRTHLKDNLFFLAILNLLRGFICLFVNLAQNMEFRYLMNTPILSWVKKRYGWYRVVSGNMLTCLQDRGLQVEEYFSIAKGVSLAIIAFIVFRSWSSINKKETKSDDVEIRVNPIISLTIYCLVLTGFFLWFWFEWAGCVETGVKYFNYVK